MEEQKETESQPVDNDTQQKSDDLSVIHKITIFVIFTALYIGAGPLAPIMAIPSYLLYKRVYGSMGKWKGGAYSSLWFLTWPHYWLKTKAGVEISAMDALNGLQAGINFVRPQICCNCRQDVSPGLKQCPHCKSDNLAFKS